MGGAVELGIFRREKRDEPNEKKLANVEYDRASDENQIRDADSRQKDKECRTSAEGGFAGETATSQATEGVERKKADVGGPAQQEKSCTS